ncbi:MAG: DUF3793 family protein [Kiritimatiellae bacterium]|nr:DUF3793 family protein [Kiritimatiellia bacterium]
MKLDSTNNRPAISERHRKELLRFLLEKTAAVRMGIKPGELLRVKHCYETENSEGLRYCLYRRDVYETLALDFVELLTEKESSLVLFYDRAKLAVTLADPANRAILSSEGYPAETSPEGAIAFLGKRFSENGICHEVGVFVGYPAKDVRGFMEHLPTTSAHGTPWRIFGDVAESARIASLYRRAERFARETLDSVATIGNFFDFCNHASYAFK